MEKKNKKQEEEANPGNKDFQGATSADFDKIKMQTVEGNELDGDQPGKGNDHMDSVRGTPLREKEDKQEDEFLNSVDQGSTRTAAFDEGNEPRSEESLKNRGTTQGSRDIPDK